MNKLIATLALALGISGTALAGDYFTNIGDDLANVPVSQNQAFDGEVLDWTHAVVPVPASSPEGIAGYESGNDVEAG